MAKFFHESVDWFRKSFSEHEGIRQTNSLDIPPREVDGEVRRKPRSISTSEVPSLVSADSLDLDLPAMPEIEGTSSILKDDEIEELCHHLPARLSGAAWFLRFSTDEDGFSLNNIYRKMEKEHDCASLLVIQSTSGHRFGAFVSEGFKIREFFYGNGQSFLFKVSRLQVSPSEDEEEDDKGLRVWNWSTKNECFVNCCTHSVAIGASDGRFGITLDSDLNHGRTDHCDTFDNEPLDPNKDFMVTTIELWTFN